MNVLSAAATVRRIIHICKTGYVLESKTMNQTNISMACTPKMFVIYSQLIPLVTIYEDLISLYLDSIPSPMGNIHLGT